MDIPGYRILRRIGEGAMASVYLAVQISLGRQVALKVLAPALAAQRGFTARFLNEGRIIAYLKHPQIVDVYDLGSDHQNYFLAMEFLSAGTLEQRIKKGISPARSVQLIKQIATALGFAHQQGVIHRDVKPQNILFRDDDLPVLTDFGIARLMDGDPQLTIPGRTLGSPFYMSPEQINGCTIDARADLYALGILFYTMLTNKLPYESDQIMTIALMHKSAPLPVLPDDLSPFQLIINKLLAKDPDQRFSSAQDLIDALVRIESEYPFVALETDQGEAVPQPPVRLAAAERIGLLGLVRTNPSDHALAPTLGADPVGPSPPGQNQAGFPPDKSIQESDRSAHGASDSRPAWIKAVVLGGATLVTGAVVVLAFSIFRPASLTGWLQPATHSQAAIEGDVSLRSTKDDKITISQQPPEVPLPLPQNDPAPSPETALGNRPAVDQKVTNLLAKAQNQLAKYHLTAPVGDNSYETVQQILALDPSSQAADSIVTRIIEAYYRLALGAKAKGRLQQSLRHVGNGLRIRPEDSMLLALQSELRMAIAEKTRIESERARLAEAQKRQQAAEQAAIEEKRKAGEELAQRHEIETEGARQEKQNAKQTTVKQEQKKIEIDPPAGVEKDADSPSRLFGTF
jgi:serine/threonine protein kinase